jgi:hypothetical protein
MSSTKSIFWVGVVEDRKDPLQLGRVRVRIHGYHSALKKDIPTEHLPWSLVTMPTTSASTSGVGSVNGLVPGTWVLGIWNEDGEQFQNSVVIATIPGMVPQKDNPTSIDLLQQNIKKSFYQENYGDGFRDPRTEEELKNEPTNKFKKKKFPDGKDKDGDKHGAQIENDKAEKFPRSNSYNCVAYNDGKMTDISIIATNDEKQIDKTIVGYKRTPREKGGLLEEDVKIASIDFKKFKCGVTNESGVNKGTNKNLGKGNNALDSSNYPSTFENYRAVINKPTNSNGSLVYGTQNKNASA